MERRDFLKTAGAAGVVLAAGTPLHNAIASTSKKKYEISLAAWSVHKMFFAGGITQIQMPDLCKELGITGLELVNSFFPSPQYDYLKQLKTRAEDNGVKILLIMCDGEGPMDHEDKNERMQAAKNHHKWVDIAAVLGCHSIRCNTGHGKAGDMEAVKRAAESFSALVQYGKASGINIIIENHGGFSSDPKSLVALMEMVDDERFGTLPDFGNFPEETDKYDAIDKMMPYAKAVSAKCYDFNEQGIETRIDFERMMKIVMKHNYSGYVGIEYEGSRLSEREGIVACKKLLERWQT
ncbi:MAG: sugar phosphate isomerase/epimerase family protein [bacterium]